MLFTKYFSCLFFFQILTEPSIMVKPIVYLDNTKTISEGDSLSTIPCVAEGIPLPSVTWESLGVST